MTMSNSEELKNLLERVKAATGPDRDMDAAIIVATTPSKMTDEDLVYLKVPQKSDQCAPGTYWLCQRSGMSLRTSETLTASVDAALALVESVMPECIVRIANDMSDIPDRQWLATVGYMQSQPSANPAIAIIVALITALIVEDHEQD